MKTIGENILNSVNILLEKRLKALRYDKTFKSTVWGVNADGTYQINYMGQLYDVPNSLGGTLVPGQSVWVKIPNGILRHMHICGINYQKHK
ncbi:MAG: hypothetical protein ACI4EQ_10670 [Lachnospiraceae bacterium]